MKARLAFHASRLQGAFDKTRCLNIYCSSAPPKMVAYEGAVAQLGERYNRTVEARGSSPLSSTTS